MLDTFSGLPVHILVVHAVVVLVPLMSLVTIAFVLRPRWRPALGWAILGNLVCVGVALLAKKSGEIFENRLGVGGAAAVRLHADRGGKLWIFAAGLLVASVLAWFLVGRAPADGAGPGAGAVAVALVLVLLGGAAATGWTVLTGDSGSRAVWGDTIKNTKAPG